MVVRKITEARQIVGDSVKDILVLIDFLFFPDQSRRLPKVIRKGADGPQLCSVLCGRPSGSRKFLRHQLQAGGDLHILQYCRIGDAGEYGWRTDLSFRYQQCQAHKRAAGAPAHQRPKEEPNLQVLLPSCECWDELIKHFPINPQILNY